MSKKEEKAEQYRLKAYEDSPNRKRCKYNSELIQWNNEIIDTFIAGWDAAIEKAALWFSDRYQSNGSYLNADDLDDYYKEMGVKL